MGAIAWLLLLVGAFLMSWGAWLVGPELGLMVTGGTFVGFSFLLSWLAE